MQINIQNNNLLMQMNPNPHQFPMGHTNMPNQQVPFQGSKQPGQFYNPMKHYNNNNPNMNNYNVNNSNNNTSNTEKPEVKKKKADEKKVCHEMKEDDSSPEKENSDI